MVKDQRLNVIMFLLLALLDARHIICDPYL